MGDDAGSIRHHLSGILAPVPDLDQGQKRHGPLCCGLLAWVTQDEFFDVPSVVGEGA